MAPLLLDFQEWYFSGVIKSFPGDSDVLDLREKLTETDYNFAEYCLVNLMKDGKFRICRKITGTNLIERRKPTATVSKMENYWASLGKGLAKEDHSTYPFKNRLDLVFMV